MADAGINVRGVSAAVIGNKFVAYVGFDSDEDAERAMAALKGIRVGPGRRSAGRTKTTTASRTARRKRPAARTKASKSRR